MSNLPAAATLDPSLIPGAYGPVDTHVLLKSPLLFRSLVDQSYYSHYMACVCRRYNARSDWLIVTEL